MRTASVHCSPSLPEQREAFGIVVLEAKGAGLPSVVVPSGNLPDLIAHKQDGWICARPDVDALVEGLRFFLTQPQTLAAAGAAARRSAENFSQERFAAAWACAAFPQEKAQAHAIP
jgi:glycosyltransferase involved in cell wall biosynthesis